MMMTESRNGEPSIANDKATALLSFQPSPEPPPVGNMNRDQPDTLKGLQHVQEDHHRLDQLSLVAVVPLLSACHTTAGAGQDISATGQAIDKAAKKATP